MDLANSLSVWILAMDIGTFFGIGKLSKTLNIAGIVVKFGLVVTGDISATINLSTR